MAVCACLLRRARKRARVFIARRAQTCGHRRGVVEAVAGVECLQGRIRMSLRIESIRQAGGPAGNIVSIFLVPGTKRVFVLVLVFSIRAAFRLASCMKGVTDFR